MGFHRRRGAPRREAAGKSGTGAQAECEVGEGEVKHGLSVGRSDSRTALTVTASDRQTVRPRGSSMAAGPKLDGAGIQKLKTIEEAIIQLQRLHGVVEQYALALKQ